MVMIRRIPTEEERERIRKIEEIAEPWRHLGPVIENTISPDERKTLEQEAETVEEGDG